MPSSLLTVFASYSRRVSRAARAARAAVAAGLALACCLFTPGLAAQDYSIGQLRSMMRGGGLERRQAIWYIQQTRADELFPEAAQYLFTSEDYDDHRAVINTMRAYGPRLENHLPNWYLLLDRYIGMDRPPDVLVECVALAVNWREHRLMPALLRLARHPRLEVRMAAFQAMASLSNDMLIPTLLRLITDERPIFRMYALEGMVRFNDTRLAPFIQAALADSSKSVRLLAVSAAAAQPNPDQQAGVIARRFGEDSDPEVRERILEELVARNWRSQISVVNRGVGDESPLVRTAALAAARSFGDRSVAVAIARQQERETVEALKIQSVLTLMELESSGGGRGLVRLLESDESARVREKAAAALGYLRERAGLPALAAATANDDSPAVRAEAAAALGRLGDNRAIGPLVETIRRADESYEIRSAAALALAELDTRESRSALEQLQNATEIGAFRERIQKLLVELRE